MLQHNVFTHGQNFTDGNGVANSSCKFFHLFHHGTKKRCIQTAIANVVKFCLFQFTVKSTLMFGRSVMVQKVSIRMENTTAIFDGRDFRVFICYIQHVLHCINGGLWNCGILLWNDVYQTCQCSVTGTRW